MIVANGATDVTTYIVVRDDTNHAPAAGLTVTTFDLYYVEELAAISSKVDATAHSAATDAHADNKAYGIGMGVYRVDWPDTCFNGGVHKKVILIVDPGSGYDDVFLECELSPGVDAANVAGGDAATTTELAAAINGDTVPGSYGSGTLGYAVGTYLTGNAYTRLGAPVAASISADIAALTESGFKKNTAATGFQFFMTDSSDHASGKTGLSITSERSLDGAAFAATTNSATEIGNGWYKITLAAADMNADLVALRFTASGADATNLLIKTSS